MGAQQLPHKRNAEMLEQLVHGQYRYLRRHHNGDDHHGEHQITALETEPGEAVSHQRAGYDLQQGADSADQQAVKKGFGIIHSLESGLEIGRSHMTGNPDHAGVGHIRRFPDGDAYHVDDGIQQHEAQAEEKEKTQYLPQFLRQQRRGLCVCQHTGFSFPSLSGPNPMGNS